VESIPILRMGEFLLVTIQVDMHDRLALTLQDDLTGQISRTGAKGVLIDISALDVVDSFIGRMLSNIAQMSRILDAETVVTGMRPAVAITLVELGMTLEGVKTALTVERGMDLLRSALRQKHDYLPGGSNGEAELDFDAPDVFDGGDAHAPGQA
jgi:rsbT antagonist protein RsbS